MASFDDVATLVVTGWGAGAVTGGVGAADTVVDTRTSVDVAAGSTESGRVK